VLLAHEHLLDAADLRPGAERSEHLGELGGEALLPQQLRDEPLGRARVRAAAARVLAERAQRGGGEALREPGQRLDASEG
jgi:hypothetical protein